jgi:hypothetical protein
MRQIGGVLFRRGFRPDLLRFEHLGQCLALQKLSRGFRVALKALLPELRGFFLKLTAGFDRLTRGVARSAQSLSEGLLGGGGRKTFWGIDTVFGDFVDEARFADCGPWGSPGCLR